MHRMAKPWGWSNYFIWINPRGKPLVSLFPCLTVLPLWVSSERAMFKAIRPHPSLQPMNPHISHTYQANKWGCLSIIDRIAVRQLIFKSRKCPRWQEAQGPQRASFCMHGPVTRAANCPSLVCFMGITPLRKNSSKRFIQPQGYSKEGSPNLRLQRFLMTTRNISTEMKTKTELAVPSLTGLLT